MTARYPSLSWARHDTHVSALAGWVPLRPMPAGRIATPSEPGDERGRRSGYPHEVRQQLLDAIYAGQPFRRVLRDLA